MNIRTRLASMAGALTALIIGLGSYSLLTLNETNQAFETTYNDRVIPIDQLKNVGDAYAIDIVDTANKLAHGSLKPTDAAPRIDAAEKVIAAQWQAYKATQLTPREAELVRQADAAMKVADKGKEELKNLLTQADQTAFQTFARDRLYPEVEPLTQIIDQLVELQLDEAKKNYQQAEGDYHAAKMITLIAMLGAVALAAGISVPLILGMSRKLNHIVEGITQARNQHDLTLRLPSHNRDELDMITYAFNDLMGSLQRLVKMASEAAHNVNHEAGRLSQTSIQVAASSEQTSLSTSAMAAAIEEITVAISQVADNAQHAHEIGQRTRDSASTGGKRIHEALTDIREIAAISSEAAEKVQTLGTGTAEISSVINVIKEVAEQTNLLALNAAIEAARAGEMGRGFAVVADEVRALAERTATATRDIHQKIGAIREEAEQAVDSMKQVTSRVQVSVEKAENATDAMESIVDEAVRGEKSIAEIAFSLDEQKTGTAEIARQVESISQNTSENSQAVGTINDTANILSELTSQLSTEIKRFKV